MRSVLLALHKMAVGEVRYNLQQPGHTDGNMHDLADPGQRQRLATASALNKNGRDRNDTVRPIQLALTPGSPDNDDAMLLPAPAVALNRPNSQEKRLPPKCFIVPLGSRRLPTWRIMATRHPRGPLTRSARKFDASGGWLRRLEVRGLPSSGAPNSPSQATPRARSRT